MGEPIFLCLFKKIKNRFYGFFLILLILFVIDIVIEIFIFSGGGQNLELRNVERPIFRNFKIANIKITKIIFHFLEII